MEGGGRGHERWEQESGACVVLYIYPAVALR